MTQYRYPLRTSAEIAPESGDERTVLTSFIHEINNPLDSLVGILYLLESEATLTDLGREHLALAREELGRIAHIAHGALDIGREAAPPHDADVSSLVRSVLELYHTRLTSRGITVLTRYCRDGNLKVYAGLLRQVFSNLLLNAADAMPRGGRLHARVAAAREWAGQQRRGLRVTFADVGCGIAAEDLPRIFSPFFTTKGLSGNGLGLSLVSDIVHKHHGVLRVRSTTKPGCSGSIFSIFLPAA